VDALERAATEADPMEACGALLGLPVGDDLLAEDAVSAQGPAMRGTFEIPDHELRRMAACAKSRGLGIVAIYHSHPSGASELSAADRASLRWSCWPWVIVACGAAPTEKLAAYSPGNAQPIVVAIVGRPSPDLNRSHRFAGSSSAP
jgi:proteasome lid subunit RPN8/RPN11